ncbi:alpha/beta hydrolase-fold protein [Mucilaginibacter sp. RS28]|uniref:Alpha/beta hydrolase-fold protein n=1 Tax=Mucilaginibacter straminoryzae TaxID=2932774 RepID=A0A9X1X7C4_9SPHI|nr:PHB depolymerase family esterase [Mucilaginibacter straminoryzae]MCJ8211495.1 alpha/beta hydrolase-fold protein [Mucilaginibacter straminoryzae]
MTNRVNLVADGRTREYLIFQPENDTEDLLPVIVSLHGTLGSAAQMMSFADFRPLAEKEPFFIVCPEGITQTWNDGRATKANLAGVDDVAFISELIDHLIATYPIDTRRVYITGMSNGGFMASRLACEIPEKITAMAAVAATLDRNAAIHQMTPLPVLYIHGTRDPMVPYNGGPTKAAGGDVYSHQQMIDIWVNVNACDSRSTQEITDHAKDSTTVTAKIYTSSLNKMQVCSYTINNGGHTWPNGPQYADKHFIGLVSHNLDACLTIWNFFRRFSR